MRRILELVRTAFALSLPAGKAGLAAIKYEFAEQIQLYLMKNLRKNQKEERPRADLVSTRGLVAGMYPT